MPQMEKRLDREVREHGGEWTWSPGSLTGAAHGLRVSERNAARIGGSSAQGTPRGEAVRECLSLTWSLCFSPQSFFGLRSLEVCHFPVFLNYETMTIWGEK